MEINDLKSIWKKANDQQEQGYWISHDDVLVAINKKSKATISKAKKEVWQKIRMSTFVGLASFAIGIGSFVVKDKDDTLFNGILESEYYGGMMIILSLVIMGISIHARIRYRQITELEKFEDSIKISLIKTKEIFKKIIRTGVTSDTIVTPLVLVFGAAIGLYKESDFALDSRLLLLIGIGFGSVFLFRALAKYLMNRKFGHFISAIDRRLAEIESIEEDN